MPMLIVTTTILLMASTFTQTLSWSVCFSCEKNGQIFLGKYMVTTNQARLGEDVSNCFRKLSNGFRNVHFGERFYGNKVLTTFCLNSL